MKQKEKNRAPLIGIIMLDTTFPRIVGDIGNPDTFSFPVQYKVVAGAIPERVVIDADPLLLQPFIKTAQQLEREGVKAIGTSCGFLAMFQRELNDSVAVPVYTSSLLQAHFFKTIIAKDQKIGILTARSQSLTSKHFVGVGIDIYPLAVFGMDDSEEFRSVFIEGKADIDIAKCRQEMVSAAKNLVSLHPDVGAIVLECTNMPPFAKDIQDVVNLPVFDVVTMINYIQASTRQQTFCTEHH